jgi:citrate synthase
MESNGFTKNEINYIIKNDILNAFFILSRTIGFIGHHIDQKRLKQDLYRCPIDSISYI